MQPISGLFTSSRFALVTTLVLSTLCAQTLVAQDDGFKSIFNGTNLEGWDGNPKFWRVEDGAITGQTTKENPTSGNTFIIWRAGELDDFELKLEYRIIGGNSGIQYRSFENPKEWGKWVVGGYQADLEAGDKWSGTNYGERFRNVLAARGQKTVIGDDHKPKIVGTVGDTKELQKHIKKEDWNEYHIIAKGYQFLHKINGHLMSEVLDEDKEARRRNGILALQLHTGPPMQIQFRNIRIKPLPMKDKKKVVFVAGRPSHGYGAHEHNAGSLLLARMLHEGMPKINTVVYRNGWPKDPSAFDNADAVVIYCDGGGRHVVMDRVEQMDALTKRGIGLAFLHYAVEVPKGPVGDKFVHWIGGYFEPHWSVNPHWVAKFKQFPDHPITKGVQPFEIKDEWYYHMRFRKDMINVTPILTDLPDKSTLSRPDGAHSGNPHVRKAIENGEPQHVAWAATRPDGGRGFGFTGGHNHDNWGNDDFRKLVLNAVAWVAKAEIPEGGVPAGKVSNADLEANQDEPRQGAKRKKQPLAIPNKPKFKSDIVTKKTTNNSTKIDVDITGAKQLVLVVTDAGNGFGCDWANWAEPTLYGDTHQTKLTDLKWKSAQSGFGRPGVNKNAVGGAMKIDGKAVTFGIGTHANSVIVYDLPKNHPFKKFTAIGGLDNGGTDQGSCGEQASVQFLVFTSMPPSQAIASLSGPDRTPEKAIAALDVGEGLEATLFAAEPHILSLSNIDIDHRGRVWACEVVNYRHFANKNNPPREAGDRILILEDTDGDGVSDKKTVFYQGRDIDSVHGVCVLGNKAIVSALDKVMILTDDDGDDKADRKDILFSGISGSQHDHGIHSFTFGPDGKLYFNFGNAGKQLKDKDGKPITDLAGNLVNDSRNPYQEGMVFRCNMDGSELETLGWNFRNNWEVAVDSFGTLWQSDNDDDGNRGVRINFVMEFGNYGYKDERTGAGWKSPRTGMSTDIPLRHWHLNDPGVVPNLLQTGGGSPTGICVYEGEMLPQLYRNQIVHCDAGPNIVRSYPVTNSGAGYKAISVNVLAGARDQWFRPSDVCVAPDGSLLVADWYDPGVGGHRMGDTERGRIFRVAVPGSRYKTPAVNFDTIEGCIEALKSPNGATRYLAWTALNSKQDKAEEALLEMWQSDNPRYRARALWLLGKIEGRGAEYVSKAIGDQDADIRICGLRLARQLKMEVLPIVKQLARDKSAQVRRECAIALRGHDSEAATKLWTQLALQHSPGDRWYLESLGLSADGNWNTRLADWLTAVGDKWSSNEGCDIIWRSRADQTPGLIAKIIATRSDPVAETARYLRAFDFLDGSSKQEALAALAFSTDKDPKRAGFIASEAIARIENLDLSKNPQYKKALDTVLTQTAGSASFIDLVEKFNLEDRYIDVLEIARAKPDSNDGVRAIQTLLGKKQFRMLTTALRDPDVKRATKTAEALGYSKDGRIAGVLMPLIRDQDAPLELRRQVVRSMCKVRNGARQVMDLHKSKTLDERLASAAAAELATASWRDIKDEAISLFPLPPSKNNKPLPPVADLLALKGDVARGKAIFMDAGTCAKCHIVNSEGKEVGPTLTEIGSKLSREAMLESILYPNAGINFGFETYTLGLTNGNIVAGIILSEEGNSISIRTNDGLTSSFKKSDVEIKSKQAISLMPNDIQKLMTPQDLMDVVDYLGTLKKK